MGGSLRHPKSDGGAHLLALGLLAQFLPLFPNLHRFSSLFPKTNYILSKSQTLSTKSFAPKAFLLRNAFGGCCPRQNWAHGLGGVTDGKKAGTIFQRGERIRDIKKMPTRMQARQPQRAPAMENGMYKIERTRGAKAYPENFRLL